MLNKVRLLTPGPTPLPERVRLVLAKDMIRYIYDLADKDTLITGHASVYDGTISGVRTD